MTTDICVYCEEKKPVVVWDKTDELVCRDCRYEFVDQDFDGEGTPDRLTNYENETRF